MGIRWLSDLAGTLRDFTVKGFLYVTGKYMTASGTNTYTATPTVALSAYTSGLEITVKFTNANSGASTLNVSSLGAQTIQINGAAVTSGQIAAGGTYVLVYDGTNFQLLGSGGTSTGINWNEGSDSPAAGGTTTIDWTTYSSFVLTLPTIFGGSPTTITLAFTNPSTPRLLHLELIQSTISGGHSGTSLSSSTLPTLIYSGSDTAVASLPSALDSYAPTSVLLWFDGTNYFVQDINTPAYPYGVPQFTGYGAGPGLVPDPVTDGFVLTSHGWDTASSGGVDQTITQAAHGFSVGQVLKYTGTAYALAKADSSSDAEVVGIVASVTSSSVFVLCPVGYVTGLSGLTGGTVYFLSDSTAGALTATAPTTAGHVSKPLFIADSTSSGWFFNYRGEVLAGASGTTYVDFGSGATDAITAVNVSGTWTLANVWIWPVASSNNTSDAHVAENLQVYAKDIVAGTSFNVYMKCTFGEAYGQYNVAWQVY